MWRSLDVGVAEGCVGALPVQQLWEWGVPGAEREWQRWTSFISPAHEQTHAEETGFVLLFWLFLVDFMILKKTGTNVSKVCLSPLYLLKDGGFGILSWFPGLSPVASYDHNISWNLECR